MVLFAIHKGALCQKRRKQHTKSWGGVPLAVAVSDSAFLILCGWLLNH